MEIYELTCWEEFEDKALNQIRSRLNTGKVLYHSQPIFRGQANESWRLETTLERAVETNFSCNKYDSHMRAAQGMIQSYYPLRINCDWEEPFDPHRLPANLSLMAYLRQNGFPSPLLDWSQSPYVAAFFAFDSASKELSDKVAIYCYLESEDGSRSGSFNQSTIFPTGPWIETDKKHYLQQGRYTVCRRLCLDRNEYLYSSHEEAFARCDPYQDHLVKYILPVSERQSVLRRLRIMNINRYSLFPDVASLIKLVALDVFNL